MIKSFSKDPRCRISEVIRDHASISRADIARLLKMSPATTGRIVDHLIGLDVVKETGQSQRNPTGRPSITLEFNAKFGSILTVDLRLAKACGVLTDMVGNVLARQTKQLTAGNTEQSVGELKALIGGFRDLRIDAPPLKSIAIGAPCLVDINRSVLEWAPSLGWQDLPLGQILRKEFELPVLVENDINLAALGEFWKGAGQTSNRNIVFVSVGTGVGAGIILDGELYRGATNAAGEVSYFVTDLDVFRRSASKIGSLESRIGHKGLIRFARLAAERYPTSELAELIHRENGEVDPRDIFDLAMTQDPAALAVFNEVVDILAIVVANLSVVLDPEVIILGGPSEWPWPVLIDSIQEHIGSKLLRPINLQPSVLGNDAVIMGGTFATLNLRGVVPA